MLAAEQAAEKHHIGKGRRHRQQPDPDILLHQRLDRRASRQQNSGERQHQRCRKNKTGAEAKRQHKAAHHMVLNGRRITPPVRLRDKAGGAHPQEAEPEIDEIENKAAERDAADEARIFQPSHHRGIGGADERKGDVGEQHRPGDCPDMAPACLLLP